MPKKITQQDLEANIIALMLRNPENVRRLINAGITQSHFWHESDGGSQKYYLGIFSMIMHYYSNYGNLPSAETFQNEISKKNLSAQIVNGINRAWFHIQSCSPREEDIDYYIDEIIAGTLDHRIANVPHALAEWRQENVAPSETLAKLEEYIYSTRSEVTAVTQQSRVLDVTKNPDTIKKMYEDGKIEAALGGGVRIGVPEIDSQTQGFRAGQLIIFLGEAGGGKSTVMLNAAVNASASGKNVLFFSFEMPLWQCVARFMACKLKKPYNSFKHFDLTPEEEYEFHSYLEEMNKGDQGYFVFVDQSENCTVEEIEYHYKKLKASGKPPDVIFVDYLGNMAVTVSAGLKDYDIESMIVPRLRGLGRKYNIPVITAQQVTKEGIKTLKKKKEEGKYDELNLSSDQMAGSRKAMDYADYVFGISQQRDADLGTAWMWFYCVKGRDIFFDPFNMMFQPECSHLAPVNIDQDIRRAIFGSDPANQEFQNIMEIVSESIQDFDDYAMDD